LEELDFVLNVLLEISGKIVIVDVLVLMVFATEEYQVMVNVSHVALHSMDQIATCHVDAKPMPRAPMELQEQVSARVIIPRIGVLTAKTAVDA